MARSRTSGEADEEVMVIASDVPEHATQKKKEEANLGDVSPIDVAGLRTGRAEGSHSSTSRI